MIHQHSVSLEVKFSGPHKFSGYASIFGNVDDGGDVVLPGAFSASLKKHKQAGTMPAMFWMHEPDQVPGVWSSMSEDRKGLAVEGEVLDTSLGRDVRTLLDKKAVRGLSIGYRVARDGIEWRDDGVRVIKQVAELVEVSIVSLAMNPLAQVEAMKAARLSNDGEYVPTEREMERLLRKIGCSRTVAEKLLTLLFEGSDADSGMLHGHQRDAGNAEDEAKAIRDALHGLTDRFGAAALARIAIT